MPPTDRDEEPHFPTIGTGAVGGLEDESSEGPATIRNPLAKPRPDPAQRLDVVDDESTKGPHFIDQQVVPVRNSEQETTL